MLKSDQVCTEILTIDRWKWTWTWTIAATDYSSDLKSTAVCTQLNKKKPAKWSTWFWEPVWSLFLLFIKTEFWFLLFIYLFSLCIHSYFWAGVLLLWLRLHVANHEHICNRYDGEIGCIMLHRGLSLVNESMWHFQLHYGFWICMTAGLVNEGEPSPVSGII